MHVSEALDTQTIGGVQLTLEKLATCVANTCKLKQISRWEKTLNRFFRNEDFCKYSSHIRGGFKLEKADTKTFRIMVRF